MRLVPSRRRADDRPPQLVLRFAVVTALSLACAGALVLFVIRTLDLRDAERESIERAELVTDVLLRPSLAVGDLAAPAGPRRRAELDTLLRRHLQVAGVNRISIVDARGRIVYSSDHRVIGRVVADPEIVTRALTGSSVGRVETVAGSKVLSAYVPIVVGRSSRVGGAVIADLDYAAVASSADAAFFPVAGVFEAALIGLFLLLVPSLASASRRLRRHADELSYRASHDELTGLPNRYAFSGATEALLATASGEIAVVLVDLDRFRDVNDALGHSVGDQLLVELTTRLAHTVGAAGALARPGGDEFAIASPTGSIDEALGLAETVRRAVERPFELAGVSLQLGCSVGIAVAPDAGTDAETLMRHADIAMYEAKRAGGGVSLYTAEHDDGAERLALVAELRTAIETGHLDVWFQPIVSLDQAEAHAVEALVRWRHPTRGLLSAATFVPLAEQTGLIKALNRLVLTKALARQATWRASGIDLDVTVNLTMLDLLDTTLPGAVEGALRTAGVPPEGLVLEITETTAMTDSQRVRETLLRLRGMGVRLAIDDFGTGHSSLAYLQQLPVQIMKIDRSFVEALGRERGAEAIIRSTIELGRALGLDVVAEGIETPGQAELLTELGCRFGQGYFFSPPVPYDELVAVGDEPPVTDVEPAAEAA